MEHKKSKIKNQTAARLNQILGEAKFKSVGDELFLPMIELIGSLSATAKKTEELHLATYKQFEVEPDARGFINFPDMQTANKVKNAIDAINDKLVEVNDTRLFTREQFKKFSDENPELKGADLLEVLKYLVKE